MTQSQVESAPLHCPRCGGVMRKPSSSSTLYWHADNNHPRCDITNITESALEIQATKITEPPPEAPKRQRKK